MFQEIPNMPLPNNAGSGDLLLTAPGGNFLSQIQGYANQVNGIAGSLGSIWGNVSPIWSNNPQNAAAIGNSGYTQNQPLSITVPAQPTTGSVPPIVEKKTDYVPWIIGGGIALVVVVLLMKG